MCKKKGFLSMLLALLMLFGMLGSVPAFAEPDTLQDGLQVWYKFDELSGTTAYDSSGNNYNATVVGGAAWQTVSGIGKSLLLNNATDKPSTPQYVSLPYNILENVPGSFTISSWVNVTRAPVWSRLFDFGPSNSSNIMFMAANSLYFGMNNANHFDPPSSVWPVNNTGQWIFVTVTWDGSRTTIYVNGEAQASGTQTSTGNRVNSGYNYYIGKAAWDDPYPQMQVREFRIYNRALSSTEVPQLMAATDLSDQVAVKEAIATIDFSNGDSITENLHLPTDIGGVTVNWVSSNSDIIDVRNESGVVTRPLYGTNPVTVTLTATFTKGSYTEPVTYTLTILPRDDSVHTMTVDAGNPGIEISPTLYGIFYEDINHAADGGVYAELVSNRSFEDSSSAANWSAYNANGTTASMAVTTANLLNSAQARALRLSVTDLPVGSYAGIQNSGYWGMNLVDGTDYDLTFFAKGESYSGTVKAVLLDAAGNRISDVKSTQAISSDWSRYALTLTATGSAPKGRLALFVEDGTGNVCFDVVSLFPPTYKDTENGLRIDLAEKIEAMKPTFNRFPGGCFVEGNTLANAFRWKNTLGDISERAGHWNLWGYRTTDGLGFHEFLQMSEDLNAEPLYVLNCGMAHDDVSQDYNYWIQDALAAIEYANGDITTEWGAKRAANGHPEPFNMRYIEIGNENNFNPSQYIPRYQYFYDAIREKYPYMNIISNMDIEGKTIDIVDEHYYSNPQFFIDNAYKYDNYSRNAYDVYVGEYAVTSECGQGNLHAALGEAAYMTGLERNSDVVIMSSYAPLLVNVNDRTWNPDAINYDSSRSYGTPAYHNQVMFGANTGDVILPTDFTSTAFETPDDITGGFGVGTWNTSAQYDDVVVTDTETGATIFSDDFSGGTSNWSTGSGTWTNTGNRLNQTSTSATDCRATAGSTTLSNYTYEVKATKVSGSEGFLIMFGRKDTNNYYWLNLGGWSNTRHSIEKAVGGTKHEVVQSIPGSIQSNVEYTIRIELDGRNVKCYVNNELMFNYTDYEDSNCPLYYVSSRDNTTGDIIMKVVNVSDTSYYTDVKIEGASNIGSEGTAITLTSASLQDENSLDNPEKVAPVTSSFTSGGEFNYNFSKHSVTVLRIPAPIDTPEPKIDSATLTRGTGGALLEGGNGQLNVSAILDNGQDLDLDDAEIAYFSGDTNLAIIRNDGSFTLADDFGDNTSLKVWAKVIYKKQVVATNELVLPLGAPEGEITINSLTLLPGENDAYTASARVTNRSGSNTAARLIVAEYNGAGVLVAVHSKEMILPNGDVVQEELSLPRPATGHTIKAYLWQLPKLVPLCENLTVTVQ